MFTNDEARRAIEEAADTALLRAVMRLDEIGDARGSEAIEALRRRPSTLAERIESAERATLAARLAHPEQAR